MQCNRRSLMLGCSIDPTEAGSIRSGGIYAFGTYYPCSMQEHWNSSWSRMVLQVKRRDAWIIMRVGQLLAVHLDCWLQTFGHYVITYVPGCMAGHSTAVREGDCASKRLAASITEHLADPSKGEFSDLLVQVRHKKPQHRCTSISERRSNVSACYSVASGRRLSGQTVILVDDVVTTGATMRECKAALMKGGANGVIGIAMARTVRTKAARM
jgi:predicted amidophosphoribosyltransferase